MNKTILVFAVALMALTMLATPALAETPKKIPVTIVHAGRTASVDEIWETEGGTYHTRSGYAQYTSWTLTGDGISLSGYSYNTFIGNLNLKTGEGVYIYDSTVILPDGTFEGHGIAKGTATIGGIGGVQVIDGYLHAVAHGTGAYKGWTLVYDYAIPLQPGQPMVYLLIP